MRRIAPRHVFAAFILTLELPILAPIMVGAIITGVVAAAVELWARTRTTLANLPTPAVTVRHEHSAPI
jgi:hypothetical protein